MTWRVTNAQQNDFFTTFPSNSLGLILLRANVPYDPWVPLDSTTGSARWYNTISTLYTTEQCKGASITVKVRQLFPVSGNRYTAYWRMFVYPCTYAQMTAVQSSALSLTKVMRLPGIRYTDIGPLNSGMAFKKISMFVKPKTVVRGQYVNTGSAWTDMMLTGSNPPIAQAVYWVIGFLPLKTNTVASDLATLNDSLLVDIKCNYYMIFSIPKDAAYTPDTISGTDTAGSGETLPALNGGSTADINNIPGTVGAQ